MEPSSSPVPAHDSDQTVELDPLAAAERAVAEERRRIDARAT